MANRIVQLVGIAALALVLTMFAQTAWADDPPGAKLFQTYCASCHGEAGKGGFGPAIGTEKFLGGHDDASMIKTTSEGVAAKGMPAWSKANGGSLSDDQIAEIIAYLRSLSPGSSSTVATSAPTAVPTSATAPTVAVIVQTRLTLAQATGKNGSVVLKATLTGEDGKPIEGAAISFSRATSFGNLDLGSAKTNSQGLAALTVAEVPSAARQVVAAFKGDKSSAASQSALRLEPSDQAVAANGAEVNNAQLSMDEPLLSPDGSLITPNPPLVPATLFVMVVLGVWSIYALVVYQLFRVRKAGVVENKVNTLTFRQ